MKTTTKSRTTNPPRRRRSRSMIIRMTPEEWAAFTRAANGYPLATWARVQLERALAADALSSARVQR